MSRKRSEDFREPSVSSRYARRAMLIALVVAALLVLAAYVFIVR